MMNTRLRFPLICLLYLGTTLASAAQTGDTHEQPITMRFKSYFYTLDVGMTQQSSQEPVNQPDKLYYHNGNRTDVIAIENGKLSSGWHHYSGPYPQIHFYSANPDETTVMPPAVTELSFPRETEDLLVLFEVGSGQSVTLCAIPYEAIMDESSSLFISNMSDESIQLQVSELSADIPSGVAESIELSATQSKVLPIAISAQTQDGSMKRVYSSSLYHHNNSKVLLVAYKTNPELNHWGVKQILIPVE